MAELDQDLPDESNEGGEHIPQLSTVEQRAMEQGWVPQDEWTGDPDDWRPAKEFVDRGELLKSISALKRENQHIKQVMSDFGRHHAQVREIEYKRALADLKAQKREALIEGDADKVIEIDETMDELKDAKTRVDTQPQRSNAPAEPHPAFMAWEQRNGWYKSERGMKGFADEVAREQVERGERDPVKILEAVDKAIRKEFPHKFSNPNRERAGAVEGSSNNKAGTTRNKYDDIVSQMNEDELRIMRNLVKNKVMTREEYLEEYKSIKNSGR